MLAHASAHEATSDARAIASFSVDESQALVSSSDTTQSTAPHAGADHAAGDPNALTPGPSKPEEIEAEVRANILGQTVGLGTVADLKLSDDFLRRVSDRVIRSSYEERYRIVVRDDALQAGRADELPVPTSTWSLMVWIGLGALALTLVLTVWKQRRKAVA